ncbi:MAG: L-seryl-tRNA(Sec) selenium transferase [Anaerolineales bacterium]|nr:L-seryl-tRNA(Sec) selenium transferase [Anaerolineales bacterium]
MAALRDIPSVEQLLQTQIAADLIAAYGRPLMLRAVRKVLDNIRVQAGKDQDVTILDREGILDLAAGLLEEWIRPTLIGVINATGVILHTNLGRAPLSQAAIREIEAVAQGYSTLEFDLGNGKRGSRTVHAEGLLKHFTGAGGALVVNNNASAVMLVLSALAARRRVVIARSQLIEIGGGFRVPDVMKQSGAKLLEVGTTNRVRISDYEVALEEKSVALVMRAHYSNFRIIGFTEEPELKAIAEAAHRAGVLLVDDIGSGALLPTEQFGLGHEPTVQESLSGGADLVCFSGDKLLGGPQAGIILGSAELVNKIKKHPLARAIRPDKVCLAGLTATLLHYLKNEAEREIPVWRMISASPSQLKARAGKWAKTLGFGAVAAGESTVGGGSLPDEVLPTFLFSLEVPSPDKFLKRLREQSPPVIARIQDGKVVLDPRTILPEQEGALLVALQNLHKMKSTG